MDALVYGEFLATFVRWGLVRASIYSIYFEIRFRFFSIPTLTNPILESIPGFNLVEWSFYCPKTSIRLNFVSLNSKLYETCTNFRSKNLRNWFLNLKASEMLQYLAQFLVKNTKNYNVLDIDSKHFQIRFRFSSSESSTRFPNPILDALNLTLAKTHQSK